MRRADFVSIAKALADPTRCQILEKIRAEGQLTCSDICAQCTQSQPTISHHIKTLEQAGLVTVRKAGQFHILKANEDVLRDFALHLAPRTPPAARARKRTAGSGPRAGR